jgi:transketolase
VTNPFGLAPAEITRRARAIRARVVAMNAAAGQGHTGADLSEADILAALYLRVLRFDPGNPRHPDRDRFILSKGHGVGGLYCTLAESGLLDPALLSTYLKLDSPLPGHPVRQKTPYVEVNTGALGHGLSVGVGMALSAKKRGDARRVYVLLGDGELQEGSVWEAAMSAAHFGLDNLLAIVDRNGLQLADRTEKTMALEPLDAKWRSFGFEVREADGNDAASLVSAIEATDWSSGIPHVLVARTLKGRGVSFMEDRPEWHHKVPTAQQLQSALEELE